MIRAANHSFYPRVGDHRLDQQLRVALHARDRGKATDEQVIQAQDEVATLVVADQARAFIDIVTDGLVRWDGPLSHAAGWLDGMQPADLCRWFDTNFYDRRPQVTGDVSRPGPRLLHDYRIAADVAGPKPVKMVLPGPVTFARLSDDRHYGDVAILARAVAAAFAEEVAALRAEGATYFQLDEPLLCRFPEDAALVAETAGTIFEAAGPEAVTVLSTFFGDLGSLAGELTALPGTHLGLDMVGRPANEDVLRALPEGRGVVLGLFDATTTRMEDASDVAERLLPFRNLLAVRDVIVGPQMSLEYLPRDQAFDKLQQARYLVERLGAEWA